MTALEQLYNGLRTHKQVCLFVFLGCLSMRAHRWGNRACFVLVNLILIPTSLSLFFNHYFIIGRSSFVCNAWKEWAFPVTRSKSEGRRADTRESFNVDRRGTGSREECESYIWNREDECECVESWEADTARQRSVSWQDGERGEGRGAGGGIRKSGSRQTVRLNARYVWNGVSLYRAQCARVDSLLCLSLEELPLPIPIGTARRFLPWCTPQIPRLLGQLSASTHRVPLGDW